MSSKTLFKFLTVSTLVAGLAACGSQPIDRTLSGAALGAAAGTAGAALTRNNLGPAALVGALVGGVAGAATGPRDVDLGEPIWRRR